ncbi:hypothetical protein HanRHA438_Chr01g0035081 [Helianthus annuus]|nr:hypothetical protein HanRHA438_Chr01g0035081 [Helianthus annuus]
MGCGGAWVGGIARHVAGVGSTSPHPKKWGVEGAWLGRHWGAMWHSFFFKLTIYIKKHNLY